MSLFHKFANYQNRTGDLWFTRPMRYLYAKVAFYRVWVLIFILILIAASSEIKYFSTYGIRIR